MCGAPATQTTQDLVPDEQIPGGLTRCLQVQRGIRSQALRPALALPQLRLAPGLRSPGRPLPVCVAHSPALALRTTESSLCSVSRSCKSLSACRRRHGCLSPLPLAGTPSRPSCGGRGQALGTAAGGGVCGSQRLQRSLSWALVIVMVMVMVAARSAFRPLFSLLPSLPLRSVLLTFRLRGEEEAGAPITAVRRLLKGGPCPTWLCMAPGRS